MTGERKYNKENRTTLYRDFHHKFLTLSVQCTAEPAALVIQCSFVCFDTFKGHHGSLSNNYHTNHGVNFDNSFFFCQENINLHCDNKQ